MKVYIVRYMGSYQDPSQVECVTNNFDKWFKQHNEDRVADKNEPEHREEFVIEETKLELFNE